jgi:hypothetical protein
MPGARRPLSNYDSAVFGAKILAMQDKSFASAPPAATRVAISLVIPILASIVLSLLLAEPPAGAALFRLAVPLAALGVAGWLLGLRWYGLRGLGLRGQRPLYAGIGFAALPWVVFLVARFATVAIQEIGSPITGRLFLYLLLFEAFSVQLWAFGLVFRAVSDWRGPLTAAVTAGLLFGGVAFVAFQESFVQTVPALLYFLLWGLVYGLIRLRSGSILGAVIVQAMHTLTAWDTLAPFTPPATHQLHLLYLIAGSLYLVIIWRLWPKEEGDYRV